MGNLFTILAQNLKYKIKLKTKLIVLNLSEVYLPAMLYLSISLIPHIYLLTVPLT
jgi:hypothetical protein